MTKKRVLITGGAGFIGSHLADELLAYSHQVRVLDSLLPQVHGEGANRPPYLPSEVELVQGDVRDRQKVEQALDNIDVVYHLAARVGVGQSMYQVKDYTAVNTTGTAVLMEALARRSVEKLIVASSMSIYGEGLYQSPAGYVYPDQQRTLQQLQQGVWEIFAEGEILQPIPTPETKRPQLASVYALTKYDQEKLCLISGQAYGIPTVALRFFNVYGTRQALSNPYTGILAIFASRLLNDKPPLIFEDGEQRRDLVHVKDVTRACRLTLETLDAKNEVFNIGGGRSYTVSEIARRIGKSMGKENITPLITGKYRAGDIRHCFADITQAQTRLGFQPQITLEEGLPELIEGLTQQMAVDKIDQATQELIERGLIL